jgi:predicted RNase H-like nuclease (RuvC/YqgF family)
LTGFTPELGKRGVSESELKPAYLFLAGCESDLIRLSKATKNQRAVSEHSAAAKMWLQKVFGKTDATKNHDKENRLPSFQGRPWLSQMAPLSDNDRDNISRLKREIQFLRDQNAQQAQQLARLRSSKRKIEDDYHYERKLRQKYQHRDESVQEKTM